MTSLLELDSVSKRYRRGTATTVALNNVSLTVDRGELLAVWGQPRSGRSTLLRIVAALEAPDSGSVRFDGQLLAGRARSEARAAGLRYCRRTFHPADGLTVLDQLVSAQALLGVHRSTGLARANTLLEHVGMAPHCGSLRPIELSETELVLVAIARSLLHRPRLLVIDDPAIGVGLLDRDRLLSLLRLVADDGVAVLMSVSVTTEMAGADRALFISNGELHGDPAVPDLAQVVHMEDLARRRTA